jgi:drug/metabolite transporter (DMT)-like permease
MNVAADTMIAVLAGLAAAGSFGVGAALQHRPVQLAPMTGRAPFRLLAHLSRRRLWLAGIALTTVAYGLQALALAFGPLALVAPVVATDLLFAIPLAARWARMPIRAPDWAGCALAAAGVAVFLAASPAPSGRVDAPAGKWAVAVAAVVLVAGAVLTSGMLTQRPAPAGLLAVAAGSVFGLTAALTLSVARLLGQPNRGLILGHWQLWALLALGAIGSGGPRWLRARTHMPPGRTGRPRMANPLLCRGHQRRRSVCRAGREPREDPMKRLRKVPSWLLWGSCQYLGRQPLPNWDHPRFHGNRLGTTGSSAILNGLILTPAP